MLKRVAWLTDSARDRLAIDGRMLRFRARQPIYLEQSAADRIYLLLTGVVKLYHLYHKQRVLVAHLRTGDTFGISALFPDTSRRYSSEAVNDCMVLSIRPQTFAEAVLGSRLDEIAPALANTLGPWFDLIARYTQFVSLGARGRLAVSLLELAEKFGIRDARGILIPLPLSHAELGTMVGTSRQHVTTQLREFERDGLIERAGRRLIVIPERMRSELEE